MHYNEIFGGNNILESSTLSLISAVTGLVGAAGGLFAAIAAYRSAGTATRATEQAQQVERRELVRDVIAAIHAINAESMRIDNISTKLIREYRELSLFTKTYGGSRHKLLTEEVEEKKKNAMTYQKESSRLHEKVQDLRIMTEEK